MLWDSVQVLSNAIEEARSCVELSEGKGKIEEAQTIRKREQTCRTSLLTSL